MSTPPRPPAGPLTDPPASPRPEADPRATSTAPGLDLPVARMVPDPTPVTPGPKVDVRAIPLDGRAFTATAGDAWARDAARVGLGGAPDALEVDLRLLPDPPGARVEGAMTATWTEDCARCGRPLSVQLRGAVDLLYQPAPTTVAEEVLLVPDDLDVGFLDGTVLDLGQVVSEQLALWARDRYCCADRGASRITDDGGPCALPDQDPGPDLRRNPFSALAKLRLPE